MKVRDLIKKDFINLKVIISYAFNKGIEVADILEAPKTYEWLLDSEIRYFTKTKKYDLVVKV